MTFYLDLKALKELQKNHTLRMNTKEIWLCKHRWLAEDDRTENRVTVAGNNRLRWNTESL